jgi:hypothetical protein
MVPTHLADILALVIRPRLPVTVIVVAAAVTVALRCCAAANLPSRRLPGAVDYKRTFGRIPLAGLITAS